MRRAHSEAVALASADGPAARAAAGGAAARGGPPKNPGPSGGGPSNRRARIHHAVAVSRAGHPDQADRREAARARAAGCSQNSFEHARGRQKLGVDLVKPRLRTSA